MNNKLKILSNAHNMPLIGLGTWKLEGKDCIKTVKDALEIGYQHIDTAEMYGNEEEIGIALSKSNIKREDLFITSKVWPDNTTYEGVIKSFNESIRKLETDYLDLYLLHWPRDDIDLKEVFKAFKDLVTDGKVKSIGVSNFTIRHLKDAIKYSKEVGIIITTNQVEFHPGLFQKELLDFCKENDIIITAYSPIARGELLKNDILKEIADKHSRTIPQICLRWALQKDMIVIPKSSSKNHLKENFEIFDFELDKEDIKKIDSLGNNQRLINPGWIDFE